MNITVHFVDVKDASLPDPVIQGSVCIDEAWRTERVLREFFKVMEFSNTNDIYASASLLAVRFVCFYASSYGYWNLALSLAAPKDGDTYVHCINPVVQPQIRKSLGGPV